MTAPLDRRTAALVGHYQIDLVIVLNWFDQLRRGDGSWTSGRQ
ncbi:MAG TPA: hypothetical protein VMM17_10210 [Gemmatimonadaceae bacterium]|nr:hypothetical protein [Gemmatimonadaceae bacterium]